MKTKWKVIIGLVVVVAAVGGTVASVRWSRGSQVTVQTATVARGDLTSIVTASGEVKPRTYTNLGANAQGRIVELTVKEGDRVRRGEVVARIESIQATADVQAQRASVASAEADSASSEAGLKVQDDTIKTQQATIERTKSDLELAKINFERYEQLFKAGVVPKSDFDQRKSAYDSQISGLREAELRLDQLRSQRAQSLAQITSAQRRVTQAQAGLTRVSDILEKHDVVAPLDGIVTNLPVQIGETVVPGVQNSAASSVMTVADMSLITAEVKVDETDIVNLQIGQKAEVTIDAIPDRKFSGHVTEIGNTAILRSTGQVASSSATSSTEAKDFKVVVALDDPPDAIRPGLSCTAKIVTATRKDVLNVPIQALTVRQKGELDDAAAASKKKQKDSGQAPLDLAAQKERREEITGLFVIVNQKAEFRKVETGITGSTDIEVLSGVQPGEQIVVGSYQAIRTMRPGSRVQVDNRNAVIGAGG
ncbi:MAG: efflux RND transporter periplasmic adaptor subunit [Acidobacteriia bacterium]|nr:efflux RND transporter periplasmic adaptor subunit [Terriglobia bacterium]